MQFYQIDGTQSEALHKIMETAILRPDHYLFEHECYEMFDSVGINTPPRKYFQL